MSRGRSKNEGKEHLGTDSLSDNGRENLLGAVSTSLEPYSDITPLEKEEVRSNQNEGSVEASIGSRCQKKDYQKGGGRPCHSINLGKKGKRSANVEAKSVSTIVGRGKG